MRVVHHFEPRTDGVPAYVAFLAEHQARAGLDVHVIGPGDRGLEDVTWLDHEMRRRSPASIARSGELVRSYARTVRADLIHAHSFFAGLAVRSRHSEVPVVYTPHAWAFQRTGISASPSRWLERGALRRTDRVMCVSQGEAEQGRLVLGTRRPIMSVGSGVELSRFENALVGEEQRNLQPYVVCIGRICEQKGQLALARMWRQRVPDPELNLVFVGDADPEDVVVPSSDGNVHFVGRSNEVEAWLAGSLAAVQPSRWEAMSLATAEALASSRPVIATRVAGMQEAIVEPPLAAAGAVVDTLDQLMYEVDLRVANPLLRRAETRAAKKRAEALFSADRLVAATLDEYRRTAPDAELPAQPNTGEIAA